jgi:hypothetical protein
MASTNGMIAVAEKNNPSSAIEIGFGNIYRL